MWRRGPLLAGEGGAGGSGGAPGGGGAPSFTQEHWDQIDSRVASVVNAALTSRLKTFEKQLGDKIEGTLGSILDKKLEGLKPPADDGGKGGKGKDDVQLSTFQKQLESQKGEIESIRAERDAERKKNRDISLRTKSIEGLGKVGITDSFMAKVALAHLREEGRIALESDESDNLVWNDDTGPVAFEVGLRAWAKSEEAKRFLPAVNVKGSGSRPGGSPPNGAAPDPAAARAEFFESLGSALRNL